MKIEYSDFRRFLLLDFLLKYLRTKSILFNKTRLYYMVDLTI